MPVYFEVQSSLHLRSIMLHKHVGVALLLLATLLSSCDGGNQKVSICGDEQTCLNDSNCFCWCSQICNPRKKTALDKPIYIADDLNGKFCYCKQWDFDHYEDNCILHKGIKEEPTQIK